MYLNYKKIVWVRQDSVETVQDLARGSEYGSYDESVPGRWVCWMKNGQMQKGCFSFMPLCSRSSLVGWLHLSPPKWRSCFQIPDKRSCFSPSLVAMHSPRFHCKVHVSDKRICPGACCGRYGPGCLKPCLEARPWRPVWLFIHSLFLDYRTPKMTLGCQSSFFIQPEFGGENNCHSCHELDGKSHADKGCKALPCVPLLFHGPWGADLIPSSVLKSRCTLDRTDGLTRFSELSLPDVS